MEERRESRSVIYRYYIKGAFDHVSKKKLAERITDLDIDRDLVGWTQSFITDRKVKLIINGYINPEVTVNISIP